jgi:hypothetical protein
LREGRRANEKKVACVAHPDLIANDWAINSCHLVPECDDDRHVSESDPFSFGLIVYQHLMGQPAFPSDRAQRSVALRIVHKEHPVMFDSVVMPV